MKTHFSGRLAIVASLVVAVGAGAAFAGIPGSDGSINACYDKQSGQVRIYDPSGGPIKACGKTETAVRWNQTGPQGPVGPVGGEGPTGDPGPKGDEGPKGDAGVFAGSFSSPNGQFTLSVTDAGIVLSGPSGTITLDANGIAVSGADISVSSGSNLALQIAGDLSTTVGDEAATIVGASSLVLKKNGDLLADGSQITVSGSGTLSLSGATVRLNGCGAFVAGSSTVCAG